MPTVRPDISSVDVLPISRMANWAVVVADDALPAEHYAAAEFGRLFALATGRELAITATAPRTTGIVLIGPGPLDVSDLGDEGLRIAIEPNQLAIAGGRPRGTLYGVYEFFERYLGVRFLTLDHTHVPRAGGKLALPCEQHTYRSPFDTREAYYRMVLINPTFAAQMRLNGVADDEHLGGRFKRGRGLYAPVDEFGRTHPEYFALVPGHRRVDQRGHTQLCYSNPHVLQIALEQVLHHFDEDPNAGAFVFAPSDNDNYCRCPACQKINQCEGSTSGAFINLINQVAEQLERRHPQARVTAQAYRHTEIPPKTIQLHPNVQIQLAPIGDCAVHEFDNPSCPRNQYNRRLVEGWARRCDYLWIWDYYTNFGSYDLPHPNLKPISARLRFYRDHHVKRMFMQANHNSEAGEMCDLRNYVLCRCMWDPDLDAWELAQEFCRLHYGPAAEPILDHLEMIHHDVEASGDHPGCYSVPPTVGIGLESARKSMAFFDQAGALADDQAIGRRVDKASICAHKAVIESAPLRYKDGRYGLDLPSQLPGVIEQYITLCRSHGMTHVAEGVKVEEYFPSLRQAAEGFAAVCLENQRWQLIVLPTNNGQTVEITHKPTGRNLLRPQVTGRHTEPDFIRRAQSVHEEHGIEGFDTAWTRAYETQLDGTALTLTKQANDRSILQRRVRLDDQQPDAIEFHTTVTHHGPQPRRYQIRICPELDAATDPNDWEHESKVLTGYVKRDRWVRFTDRWALPNGDYGPDVGLLCTPPGNTAAGPLSFAYFNRQAGFGVRQTGDWAQIERPRFFWSTQMCQVYLEIITKPICLAPGESWSCRYALQYLKEPPTTDRSPMI